MSTPNFTTEAGLAGNYPTRRFNQRERKLLASVKAHLDAGLSGSQIAAGAVTLSKLAEGVAPSHVVKYAGTYTTQIGSVSQSIAVTGVEATDIVCVSVKEAGGTPRTVTQRKLTQTKFWSP